MASSSGMFGDASSSSRYQWTKPQTAKLWRMS